MTLKQLIEQDLKNAMLGGDTQRVTTLRGLKSVILYDEVAKGVRDKGISDGEVIVLLSKEAKKRQESADLYRQGGNEDRAKLELEEKNIIESYLPEQISEEELSKVIDEIIKDNDLHLPQNMGQVISMTKQKVGGTADGSRIADLVKKKKS